MLHLTPRIDLASLGEYNDKLVYLIKKDTALNEGVPDSIRPNVEWLLRSVNSFYSNKIEGNPTHPKEFLSAQKGEQSNRTKSIHELLALFEIQRKGDLMDVEVSEIVTQDNIKKIHKEFYTRLPSEALDVRNVDGSIALDKDGNPIKVVPGEYRTHDVKVGNHVPPDSSEVRAYMDWISRMFRLNTIFGSEKIVSAACLHHRLAWIHPFIDGNGRTIRLVTDIYMKNSGLGGYGLWSINRGFGRDTASYYNALAMADKKRSGDTDGRGVTSDKGLAFFVKYFIDTAIDQVEFFSDLFEISKLRLRIDYYFEMRAKGAIPGDIPILKVESRDIYKYLLDNGVKTKREICTYLAKKEQFVRPILNQMASEELISMDGNNVEIRLSPASIEFLFPNIW